MNLRNAALLIALIGPVAAFAQHDRTPHTHDSSPHTHDSTPRPTGQPGR